jgi:ribonuclease III
MIRRLEQKLGYSFNNAALLKQALTHRSMGRNNNERLEYLGDSILNFVIAEDLYQRFPLAVEGQLSRLRASLVKGVTLTKIARRLGVGPFLLLGQGEMKSGGEFRSSILADSVEAIIAAIYLDTNLDTCRQRILFWFQEEIAQVSPDHIVKDPKSTLQEYLQSKQHPLPEYELVEARGKEHEQVFVVSCKVALLDESVLGESTSLRRAEQRAAANVLAELKGDE